MSIGKVYWITGLSGAGKTTVGEIIYKRLKSINPSIIYLDGDSLREVYGNDLGYSIEDRRKCSMRNSRLCKMISEQGIDVICATISMFDECRNWNRRNIMYYDEIYLKVKLDVLKKRNSKNIYSNISDKIMSNVWGIDLEYEEPNNSDYVIENNGDESLYAIAEKIISHIMKKYYYNKNT